MVDFYKAIDLIKETSTDEIGSIYETDDLYLFSFKNDDEGCRTVNKITGAIDFMWDWDFVLLNMAGKLKQVNLELIKERAS